MSSIEVKLLRKNRRWDLFDKEMCSSASIIDMTLLLVGPVDPQDLHSTCTADFKGTLLQTFLDNNNRILEIEKLMMELRLLQFENPRYKNILSDNFAPEHPNYLNPPYQCYNLECRTCAGMALARAFSESCYEAQHSEITLERSIGKSFNFLKWNDFTAHFQKSAMREVS